MIFIVKNTKSNTILESLKFHAMYRSEKLVYTILDKNCNAVEKISFSELYNKSLRVACNLKYRGFQENQAVALACASSLSFICIFLGCLFAGVVPVPLPAPRGKRQLERLKGIFSTQGFNSIIADQSFSELLVGETEIKFIAIDSLLIGDDYFNGTEFTSLPRITPKNIAFLQYTSGSTSLPKGVMISHKNIITNEMHIHSGFGHDDNSIILGWLPFHHDMGLIGNMLQPIYGGLHSIIMSPMDFLRKPLNWLKMVSKYGATTSGGPNFAYDLCMSLYDADALTDLDLSSWRVAFNGSEMIKADTLDRFSSMFEKHGFKKNVFQSCYGLAEATLFVTSRHYGEHIVNKEDHKINIGCGFTEGDTELLIVDPVSSEALEDGSRGEVWLKGDTVAEGYWRNSEATNSTFKAYTTCGRGPFLRTGDLGYQKNGDLFITERIKNIIVIRGNNYYPIDIEEAIHCEFPVLRNNRMAAFSVRDGFVDKLTIVHEISKEISASIDSDELIQGIMARVTSEFQVEVKNVTFVKNNKLPRTTSGKIQVSVTKQLWEDQALQVVSSKSTEKILPDSVNSGNIEQQIKVILGASLISHNDVLIENGLDSIRAMTLIHFLDDYCKLTIDMASLLSGMTFGELLARIENYNHRGNFKCNLDSSETTEKEKVFEAPLSFEQENIWLAQMLNPSDCSYNIPILLEVTGRVQRKLLKSVLVDVLANYDSLKVLIRDHQGLVKQVIDKRTHCIDIQESDLSHLGIDEQKIYIDGEYKTQASTPFILEEDYPYRANLILCSDEKAYVLMTFHHIACDGWSFSVFKRDFLSAYRAREQGVIPKFDSKLNKSVLNYALEQRKGLSKRSEEFWKQQVSGLSPSKPLSPFWHDLKYSENGAVSVNKNSGNEISFQIKNEQAAKIGRFCRATGLTPASAFLGIFHCLIYNYTREQTVVNYVVANRKNTEYSQTFSCFINTLISHAKFDERATIESICLKINRDMVENYKHENYPFVEIMRNSGVDRVENDGALSRFLFVMQNAPDKIDELENVKFKVEPQKTITAMYDLVLEVLPQGDSYDVKMEYRESVIPEFLANQYKNCLLMLIDQLDKKDLVLFQQSFAHLKKIKSYFDEKATNDLGKCFDVISSFREIALKTPNKTALIFEGNHLSYEEILAKVDRVTSYLFSVCKVRGCRIVLPCDRSADYLVTLLAVLSSGACYVPIDFNQPSASLDMLLADLKPDFILGSTEQLSKVADFSPIHIDFDRDIPHEVVGEVYCDVDADAAAYIIYTSGSTGKPKGVEVSRRSLNSFVYEAVRLFSVDQNDTVLQFSALNWDTSSEEIFPSLVQGATLVFRSNNRVEHFDDILTISENNKISVWNLPSSYWVELARYLSSENLDLPRSLRLLIIGGEMVNCSEVTDWFRCHGARVTLLNTYGATELTSISMACDLNAEFENLRTRSHLPIGRPLGNTQAYVLDQQKNPVPVGSVGLLHFGGEGLANGYLNDSKLTSEKFFFEQKINKRLYNGGDYAYYDDQGLTYLIGRNDSHVKRRGVRIDLRSIESAAKGVDEINYAKAELTNSEGLDTAINLYVVFSGEIDKRNILDALVEHLGSNLPDQYHPDYIFYSAILPKLSNGKVDAERLKRESTRWLRSDQSQHPDTDTETKVKGIWTKVLKHEKYGKTHAFFDVGGNSLLILKLKSHIENELNIDVPVAELFSNSTIASQSRLIDKALGGEKESPGGDLRKMLQALESGEIDLETAKKVLVTNN